ncbi:hypothetical protein PsorP6_008492 [Peronosclerospora sorghi]|uniref:Uncharacterized protein n=1 Tax=Peronosclerospora sorghi TaxID=230839 RepID=A0ACC0W7Y1_9STRA|nr:hypothetical protein PsorP6_008492 [Peronosclerospora sorghi]
MSNADKNETSTEGLLVLVIDTNPTFWFPQGGGEADCAAFQQLISSTLVFVNSYLLLNRSNSIVIIAAHAGKSAMLYPYTEKISTSANGEQTAKVNACVIQRLHELGDAQIDTAKSNQTAVAASLSLTTKLLKLSTSVFFYVETVLTNYISVINRAINDEPDLRPRILVIQKSPDVSEHYIAIMNAIFSAQKKNVAVDACILALEQSSFMQQAAYLTGGIYYKPNDHSGLLQYLISIYLPDTSMRKLLKLPSQDSVDFRAMCFCHREVISTAFVCPVCLSLFCEFRPICSTCGIRSHIQPKKNVLLKKRSRMD